MGRHRIVSCDCYTDVKSIWLYSYGYLRTCLCFFKNVSLYISTDLLDILLYQVKHFLWLSFQTCKNKKSLMHAIAITECKYFRGKKYIFAKKYLVKYSFSNCQLDYVRYFHVISWTLQCGTKRMTARFYH